MGYTGRKRKWKSGDRPSEPANPPGQSSPQPGPSGEPVTLRDDQEVRSSKRSKPGAARPLARAATPPSSPQPGSSTELAAHADDGGGAASSMSCRPGAANHLPRIATPPSSPQLGTSRERVALAGATSSTSSTPGQALPRAPTSPRSPQPVASRQVRESMEVPGAGPRHGEYQGHAPPQAITPDHQDPLVNGRLASLPQSTADAVAAFSTLMATMLMYGENDINVIAQLENFLGGTNRQLSQMIHDIETDYNGGFPLVRFDPAVVTEQTRCPICLEDYGLGDIISVLPCQHLLHSGCIQQWLERSRTCPVCRAGV
ncbi:RING finger protein 44-like [Engraulis encrasicolus]|uniref:RING finger protein 44-like n=1 Tax=Engraulis encrasicolus TaxID=184585 RepID=UPI002FD0CE06